MLGSRRLIIQRAVTRLTRSGGSRPELRLLDAAAQTRIVSKARIRLDSRKSVRSFKGIICNDISEFESYMPSQAVGVSATNVRRRSISVTRANAQGKRSKRILGS